VIDVHAWLHDRFPEVYRPRKPGPKHVVMELPQCGRHDLAQWTAQWGFTTGAEIGVDLGRYSKILLDENPTLTLIGVDAWVGKQGPSRRTVAVMAMEPYGDRSHMVHGLSVEAALLVPDASLDFVYIDADHQFSAVVADLAAWEPKVRSGGVVSGHDYFYGRDSRGHRPMHIIEAVHGWAASYRRELCILGRKAIEPGDVRDRPRSWMWVKP